MVIQTEDWKRAIDWTVQNEGQPTYEIESDGRTVYHNRNKVKCLCRYEQLVYRFKLEHLLPESEYSLSSHAHKRTDGSERKDYVFRLKHKDVLKGKPIYIQKARLTDALLQAYTFDVQLPDRKDRP